MLVELAQLKNITEIKTTLPDSDRITLEILLDLVLEDYNYSITVYIYPERYLKRLVVSIEDYKTETEVMGKLTTGLSLVEFINKHCRTQANQWLNIPSFANFDDS